MSEKTNKLINQEIRVDYGDEAAEGTTVLSQGDKEFERVDEEFEEACAEENTFDATRAEESAVRARLQRAGNMSGYATGMANETEVD